MSRQGGVMSQSKVRKATGGSDPSKVRASLVKAAGDTALSRSPTEHPQKIKTKSKLPKNVQYDLENALVSVSQCLHFL